MHPLSLHSESHFWRLVLSHCQRLGLSLSELAEKAELSRTTLHQLSTGKTRQPQSKTVHRIAEALGVDPTALTQPPPVAPTSSHAVTFVAPVATDFARFNELTNPEVTRLKEHAPELFQGWSASDFEELYSCFGVGGALTEEGVRLEAARICEKRETVRKLEILLETHLREAVLLMVDSLFQSVQATPESLRNHS